MSSDGDSKAVRPQRRRPPAKPADDDTFSEVMQAAEDQRAVAEESRHSAEMLRERAEGARQYQEQLRAAAEQARAVAEELRETAEQLRGVLDGARESAQFASRETQVLLDGLQQLIRQAKDAIGPTKGRRSKEGES